MTDPRSITPPPELVQQWRNEWHHAHGELASYIATQAARWGDEQRLKACIELLDINGCPDRYINMLRDGGPQPQPQPSLKEQALDRCNDYIDPDGIIRRALEQLPEDPAVTPPSDDRGPGSVAEQASPVATDKHIADVFERIAGWRYNYPHTLAALRAIYDLGREHGAAQAKPTPSPSKIRSSSPEPAAAPDRSHRFPTPHQIAECGGPCLDGGPAACDCGLYQPPAAAPDRPLLELMWGAYIPCNSLDEGMIAPLRVVADWLEATGSRDLAFGVARLRAEAERAEAGE